MVSDVIDSHFRNPYNRRELSGAAGTGRAGTPECGAEISIYIGFEGDHISVATFEASGSSAIIAAGSVLASRLEGLDWRQAAAINPGDIYILLVDNGGDDADWTAFLPSGAYVEQAEPGSTGQACIFAIEALHKAFEDSLRRGTFPEAGARDVNTVLVAMSGGVDSSTACLLEQKAGKQVIGVTMRLIPEEKGGDAAVATSAFSCCSSESIVLARRVCHALGVPHLTVDYTGPFQQTVVDDFIEAYLGGRTPNPCTTCNGSFRFPALIELAGRLGAAKVATGHYARITQLEGSPLLARGRDAGKDQSYMLWGIDQSLLPSIEFPLGDYEKRETRELARRAGLGVHDRVDSQDVCFIPDDDYRGFITERAFGDGAEPPGEGEIVDTGGNTIGRHGGYLNFTVGQRRGLGVSAPEPLYVLRTDPAANEVIVGAREELAVSRLALEQVNAFLPRERLEAVEPLRIQVRYNSPAVTCRLLPNEAGGGEAAAGKDAGYLWLELEDPVYGVATGQSGVVYIDDMVVAGGVIARTA